MKKVRQFTIKKAGWVRGKNLGDEENFSSLENKRGNKCCLGFYAEALGNPVRSSSGNFAALPSCISDSDWPKWLVSKGDDTKHCYQLSLANDKEFSRERDRERRIKQLFARQGIKVNFID